MAHANLMKATALPVVKVPTHTILLLQVQVRRRRDTGPTSNLATATYRLSQQASNQETIMHSRLLTNRDMSLNMAILSSRKAATDSRVTTEATAISTVRVDKAVDTAAAISKAAKIREHELRS